MAFLLTVEGTASWCFSFVAYSISLASRGKTSVAHSFLYNELFALSPTNESVALIAGVSTTSRVPKTLEERLTALELASRSIRDGMVAVDAMKVKETALFWQQLEWTSALVLGCVLAMLLRWTFAWIKVWRKPCCADIDCWVDWVKNADNTKPILALLALATLQTTLGLGKFASKLPKGSPLLYSPSSYTTAWLFALSTFSPLMPKSLGHSLEELAARLILLSRILGIRIDDELTALQSLSTYCSFGFAILTGYLGFILAEPVSTSIELFIYRSYAGQVKSTTQGHEGPVRAALVLAVALPLAIVVMTVAWNSVTTTSWYLSCVFALSLLCLAKPLLQCHLDRSLPATKATLEQKDTPTPDTIIQPFKSRRSLLLSTGSKLVILPFLLVSLLTLTSLCNRSQTIYSVGYGGSLAPDYLPAYDAIKAASMSRSAINTTSFAGMNTCGVALVEPRRKSKKQVPVAIRGQDLLEDEFRASMPWTIAATLGGLQSPSNEDDSEKNDVKYKESSSVLTSIWHHPLVTGTIALPILDIFLFMIVGYWLQALAFGWLFSDKIRKEIGSHAFVVEESKKSS